MRKELIANSIESLSGVHTYIDEQYSKDRYLIITVKSGKLRSTRQQASIEVYCRELAERFNDAGLDQRAVLAEMSEGVEIPWEQESVKGLWRRIQESIFGKKSTAKLERSEVSRVYNVFNRWTADKFGISMNFPSNEVKQ